MQKKFVNINFMSKEKTFTKAIDEFNYVNITMPLKKLEELEKKNREKK